MHLENRPDFMRFISGLAFPLCNAIFRARLAGSDLDEQVESLIAPIKERNLPMFWWTGPATQPANLAATLEAHGLSHADSSPGMAMDLSTLQPEDLPDELTIERVSSIAMVRQWSGPFAEAFDIPDFVVNFFEDAFTHIGFDEDQPYRNYLGFWKGEPVACSSCFVGAGVAGIYNVATRKQARGCGIGSALTKYPLLEARNRGYRVGILHASEMGYPVYLNMGFKEYCRVNAYIWQPTGG